VARVIVVGSINMDVVARTARQPQPGETVLGTGLQLVPGGKGANQAVAASRMGVATELVGRVGRDVFSDLLVAFLTGENVGLSGLRREPEIPSGTALIVVDDAGENTIVVVPGANHAVTTADVEALRMAAGDIVVLQFEVPLDVVDAALAKAQQEGARSVLNPAPAQMAPPELLARADFVVVNESELAFFAQTEDLMAGLETLRQRPDQVVIATLGAEGATALIGSEVLRVAGRPVAVVDTTGAGDCFVGALAAALCSWADVEDAIHFANLAASVAVQRFGAGSAMPALADVEGLA
jgi:ribokinase